jgi:hypothetical protein
MLRRQQFSWIHLIINGSILDVFHLFHYCLIALDALYRKSFESKSIRPIGRATNGLKAAKERDTLAVDLRPSWTLKVDLDKPEMQCSFTAIDWYEWGWNAPTKFRWFWPKEKMTPLDGSSVVGRWGSSVTATCFAEASCCCQRSGGLSLGGSLFRQARTWSTAAQKTSERWTSKRYTEQRFLTLCSVSVHQLTKQVFTEFYWSYLVCLLNVHT